MKIFLLSFFFFHT
ncbi:hypothetical protein G210_4841 [Candida maltosa Xu316]|uniref:Uncharacterized protein n=1 Tax=Candida maltosa (strain Xu316) TaxID=1245528 RepID=M3K830_CANMX|nr:hypothetical protein G210_4841 [Candida maltosa Xu316]